MTYKPQQLRERLSQLLLRLLLIFVLSYLSLLGATFNGVLVLVDLQALTLGLFAIVFVLWRVIRWRNVWQWYRNPFDAVLVFWLVAFAISILANGATWRRSIEGLWYVGLYIALCYLLMDTFGNRALQRTQLINAFLITGAIVMFFALLQLLMFLGDGLANLPRPVSLIGNANAFGSYLMLLLPFAIMQAVQSRGIGRIGMGVYAVTALLLLLLSSSRGAWAGTGVAMMMLVTLGLANHQLLSIAALRTWWQKQSKRVRLGSGSLAIGSLTVSILFAVLFLQTLSQPGRSIGLRTFLWRAAILQLTEQPLTGQGFFTYGLHLARFESTPPQQALSHAHNIPLTVAAEMGLPGLIALLGTVGTGVYLIYRNWLELPQAQKPLLIAAVAAAVGFAVHHLVDTPAMMPLIALAGLLVWTLATVPHHPQAMQQRWRKAGYSIGSVALWLVLLLAGFWNQGLYRTYFSILQDAIESEEYLAAAQALQPIIDADPRQPAYLWQQGYLYGQAAVNGDIEAAELALGAFERFVELEPTHAPNWANLAALYWQVGDIDSAQEAIEQAVTLAPEWEHFRRQQAIYSGELTGAEDIVPPRAPASRPGINWARFQFLREIIDDEYLPQVGWGSR